MVNFSLDLYVWNIERYQIVHFCIPKFKIKNVKSKWHWKESETDANAVSIRLHWEICSKTGTGQTFIGSVAVSTCKNYWIHTFQWSIYQGFVFWRKIQGSIVSKGTAMNLPTCSFWLSETWIFQAISHIIVQSNQWSTVESRFLELSVFFLKFPIFWTKPKFPLPVKHSNFTSVLQTSRYFEEICLFCKAIFTLFASHAW